MLNYPVKDRGRDKGTGAKTSCMSWKSLTNYARSILFSYKIHMYIHTKINFLCKLGVVKVRLLYYHIADGYL